MNERACLWVDPGFGASGDMMLGLLVDLGVSIEELEHHIGSLGVDGWRIESNPVRRAGLTATRVTIESREPAVPRAWSDIDAALARSSLPSTVRTGARATFETLAGVEARIHGIALDEVHFHEVGAVDAIVDIVGSWAGWYLLGEPEVAVGPFGIGGGTVTGSHGRLSLPAPAVADLLIGWTVRPLDTDAESVTPTGAALLTTLAVRQTDGPPAGRLVATGRGAGARNPSSHANVLSGLLLGHPGTPSTTESVTELVTNLDDVPGEILGHAVSRLLAEGALDVWLTPIVMKKGRPAHQLTALCGPDDAARLQSIIMAETGTLGVRHHTTERQVAARTVTAVEVDGHRIGIKIGPHGAKPEYDDVAAAAAASGSPARELARRALAAHAARSQPGADRPSTGAGTASGESGTLAE